MSKLKINDKVIVKQSGKRGIVMGRDVHTLPDGKIKIEYVVKTGEGFGNWVSCSKTELEKIQYTRETKTPQYLIVEAPNGYKVTVVAILHKEIVWRDGVDSQGFYSPYSRKGRDLSIGYSIYNPSDEYNEKVGIRIATHRAKKSPFCHLISDFSGEFNKETVDALLKVKAEYIVNNIEHFVNC